MFLAVMVVARVASADTYYFWVIDGRYERSRSPCADEGRPNPGRRAIIDFVGPETFVTEDSDGISLLRIAQTKDRARTIDRPQKRLVGPNGERIGIWYQGMRTWIVTLYPELSPAFVSVTLVIERDAKRKGTPVCYERFVAPVSP